MENLFKVILLAIIQGVTEFLPVSSSGHLVLAKHFLGMNELTGVTLEIVLNTGTLLAILVFYWSRLVQLTGGVLRREKESIRFALFILWGCIPAIAVGFLFKDQLEEAFSNPRFVSCTLIGTGLFLIGSHFAGQRARPVGWVSALLIGFMQAVALLPGVSRSGSTIGMSRFLGIEPKQAAEFSFFMLIPLSVGACLLAIRDLVKHGNTSGCSALDFGVGLVVSAVVGYYSLKWLVSLLQRGRFWRFGIYCLSMGLITFAILTFQ
jgi:undecaprenyl-diphosphatase